MQNLRVTLIQSNLHWENIPANLEMFSKKIATISETDLIVLPETFTTGFSMNPKFAETMDGTSVAWMKKTAKEKNSVVCGSLMINDDGRFYNRLVWMKPDGESLTYDKRHLFCMSDEPKFFTAGTERLIVELNGWRICPLVCYDLRFPVWARCFDSAQHDIAPYDILLYVANWPERRNVAWKTLLPARAVENQAYVIGANRVGVDEKGPRGITRGVAEHLLVEPWGWEHRVGVARLRARPLAPARLACGLAGLIGVELACAAPPALAGNGELAERQLRLEPEDDRAWLQEHTRLGEAARRWQERNRSNGLTLRGAELLARFSIRS